MHTLHAQGDVYMVVGPSYNSAFQVGKDGVLMVDPGPAANADALLAEIRKSLRPARSATSSTPTCSRTAPAPTEDLGRR